MVTRLLFLTAALLALSSATAPFNATFAKNVMLTLSAGAYSDTPSPCIEASAPSATLVNMVRLNCDKLKDMCAGFIASVPDSNAIVLAFRGTHGAEQLTVEVIDTLMQRPVAISSGGKVGPYFLNTFNSLWKGGLETTLTTLASTRNDDTELWVTGHSLGGSMAAVAAAFIHSEGIFPAEKMRLVTFGEPRTGDKDYSAMMDSTFGSDHRVTHNRDIVPHIPPEFFGYQHQMQEIFYKNDMTDIENYVACVGDEDKKCSDNYLDYSIEDHLHYYGIDISKWGEDGCPAGKVDLQKFELTAEQSELQTRLNQFIAVGKLKLHL